MPQINFYILFVTAFIPTIVGAIYYHPKILGNAWLASADITADHVKGGNMVRTLLLSYLFGLFLSYILFLFSVHQSSIFQLFLHESGLSIPGTDINQYVSDFMDRYGDRHRSFGHGVIHGVELCLLMGFAMIGISTLRERRPMKYLWIHLLFWVICGGLMGGILCAFM